MWSDMQMNSRLSQCPQMIRCYRKNKSFLSSFMSLSPLFAKGGMNNLRTIVALCVLRPAKWVRGWKFSWCRQRIQFLLTTLSCNKTKLSWNTNKKKIYFVKGVQYSETYQMCPLIFSNRERFLCDCYRFYILLNRGAG